MPKLNRILKGSLTAVGASLICATTQCVPVDESIYTPGTAYSTNDAALKRGKHKGFHDGMTGLSRNPDRYPGAYSQADRSDFLRGYEQGYNRGIKPQHNNPQPSYGQPLRAHKGQGVVQIKEGGRIISTCRTQLPNVEATRFIAEQHKIVVKSRGAHGPAEVQLFNTHTGQLLGQVKAYQIQNNHPAWAKGMAD